MSAKKPPDATGSNMHLLKSSIYLVGKAMHVSVESQIADNEESAIQVMTGTLKVEVPIGKENVSVDELEYDHVEYQMFVRGDILDWDTASAHVTGDGGGDNIDVFAATAERVELDVYCNYSGHEECLIEALRNLITRTKRHMFIEGLKAAIERRLCSVTKHRGTKYLSELKPDLSIRVFMPMNDDESWAMTNGCLPAPLKRVNDIEMDIIGLEHIVVVMKIV
jgi:hypothetical protein